MSFHEDVGFGDDRIPKSGASFGFSSFSAAAPGRYAPLPQPAAIASISTTGTTRSEAQPIQSVSRKNAGRPQGQACEPPALAVPLTNGKFADYKPWMGGASEDLLNEAVIRSGFVEKLANASSSETNMARPAVWPSLKGKHGLPLLSMLLVQVMDKRQSLGRCTASSTFKPPPRVTLTDTKREAWLRDLASTDIPLRRLSRTIPHGIRGKVLLDQCLGKIVPLPRAVWLIKCVGANEIRAFRRKGISGSITQSGELKWIREWTLCVEQFITSTLSNCGQRDWKLHIQYTVRLVAALFTEDLLDHQHFLDWLISSLASSPPEMLPIWLLLSQLFWSYIIVVQNRGQFFSGAIITQLSSLSTAPILSASEPLISALRLYLLRLVRDHRPCVIGLKNWPLAKQVLLEAEAQSGDLPTRSLFRQVIQRNDRLNPSHSDLCSSMKPIRLVLFEYLDSLPTDPSITECAERCKTICGDNVDIIASLMDWGSSNFRTGSARVYLTASILKLLANQGTILEEGILNTLSDLSAQQGRNPSAFAKIIVELVSTKHFNYGKYLQWLISTGSAWQNNAHYSTLLSCVPLHAMTAQSSSLRSAIFSRLSIPHESEKNLISLFSEVTSFSVGAKTFQISEADAVSTSIRRLQMGSRDTICQWIVDHIQRSVTHSLAGNQAIDISCASYATIRSILEDAAAYESLSTLLRVLLPATSPTLFPELAATIQNNVSVFACMGVLTSLSSLLLQSYIRARQAHTLDQMTIKSVITICRLQPVLNSRIHKLEDDLSTIEQQHAAAVCSPASDSMMTVHNGQITSDEDIDRILGSGNTMEEQMLARLFSAIVERTVKWTVNGSTSLASPTRWFHVLRTFDNNTFDRHMNNLMAKLVANPGTDQVRAILISLIASGCLKLDEVLSALEKRLDTLEASSAPQLPRFAIGSIQSLLPLNDLDHQMRNLEIYRFRMAQQDVCKSRRKTILRFYWHALSLPAEATSILFSQPSLQWLSTCCLAENETFEAFLHLGQGYDPGHRDQQLTKLINALCEGASKDITDADTARQSTASEQVALVRNLIKSSNELCLPFLQFSLRLMRAKGPRLRAVERLTITGFIQSAIRQGQSLWPMLMDSVDSEIVQTLRQESCTAIMRSAEEFMQQGHAWDERAMRIHLDVVIMTSIKLVIEDLSMPERIAELLLTATKKLEDGDDLILCINGLVKLLLFTTPAITPEQVGSISTQRVFGTVCLLLSQGQLQGTETEDFIFDCATLLVRGLSSDNLSVLHRRLTDDARQDPRLRSVLGIEDSETKWFSLASKVPLQAQNAPVSPVATQGPFQSTGLPTKMSTPSRSTPTAQSTNPGSIPTSSPQTGSLVGGMARSSGAAQDTKYNPYTVRRWELMQDPTPNAGENDTSLNLQLFGARRVY